MPRFTKFIYALIGLWLVSTLLIYTIGYSEAMSDLRGSWTWLSILFAAVLGLLSVTAFFIDRPIHWAAGAVLLVALTTVAVVKIAGGWGAWTHIHIWGWQYETIVKQVLAASTEEERKRICTGACKLLSNEPVRVTFLYDNQNFILRYIVYDPTGDVARDNYFVATDHLTGDWFFCLWAT